MPAPLIVPVVIVSGTTSTGATLARLRDVLSEELGFRHVVQVSEGASGGEAARTLIMDAVRDDELNEDAMGGWWAYAYDGAQAGTQRRILKRGHYGSEGAVMTSRAFSAALGVGTTVILTSPLPIKRHLGVKGVDDLVNEALDRIDIEARLQFTGNGTNQQSLLAYPTIRSIEQTTGLYDRLPSINTTDADETYGQGYRIALDGASATLVTATTYDTGTAYELGLIVKAAELIESGGVWALGAYGLTSDSDRAAVSETWVRCFGMVKALQHLERVISLDHELDPEMKKTYLGLINSRKPVYVRAANAIRQRSFPIPYIAPRPGLVSLSTAVSVPS